MQLEKIGLNPLLHGIRQITVDNLPLDLHAEFEVCLSVPQGRG